ncbi:MAG TPA: hypothetical protein VHP63_05440, partial [candidate division Zixibacteria bacterium]|nr:hypothetical protein [candidate division Zixibacteria bacterium]
MNGIYLYIRTVGWISVWLIGFVCLSLSANASIGFQADFDQTSSWVTPYREPDYRLSVALYPKTYPVLSASLVISPAVLRSSMNEKSLTFGYTYFKRGKKSYDLVPISVDAPTYAEYRKNQYVLDQRDFIFGQKLAKTDQARGEGGLGVSVALPKRLNKIFGEGGAGLRVSGFRKITFSGRSQWNDGQSNLLRQNKFPSL